MDTGVAKEMLRVIRAEQVRRSERLDEETNDEWASHQWAFYEEPFINELCLTLLVAIWHQVERELVLIAARVNGDGRELEGEHYSQRIQELQERLRLKRRETWKEIVKKLQLDTFAEGGSAMKTLRLLANSYKHDPSPEPGKELLKHLGLSMDVDYADLPNSKALQKRLAASLDLQDDVDYCDISEELLNRAHRFFAELRERLKQQGVLSPIKPRLWVGTFAY